MYSLEDERVELEAELEILERYLGGKDTFPTHHEIRVIISPILRKWISDDGLSHIHKEYPELSIYTVNNHDGYVEACKKKITNTWLMSLPVVGDMYVDVNYIEDKDTINDCELGEIEYDFDNFKKQVVACVDGDFITRSECIRFVANKMGGAHTQSQAYLERKESLVEFITLFVVAIDHKAGVVNALDVRSCSEKLGDLQRDGYSTYPALYLVVLDTARRFVSGMRKYLEKF